MSKYIYQWGLYLVLGSALTFSLFLISSDNQAPFTTQAEVRKSIAEIAPEVSAEITAIAVNNGDHVHQGQLLMQLDDSRYQLAFKQAQAELKQARQDHQAKFEELHVAEATLVQKQQQASNAHLKLDRHQTLVTQGLVTQESVDDSLNAAAVADSAVVAAQADIQRLRVQLAEHDGNAAVALAEAKLETARLDLIRTRITAPTDGTITNLQLRPGTYVGSGTAVLFLVNDNDSWINADFNEKGLALLQPGAKVLVAFDAIPGKLFEGAITSREQAIYDASSETSGLANITNDSRWIREQQKVRTRIQVPQLDPRLFSGSRASIMIHRSDSLWGSGARLWMQVVSNLRYLY
ncbi:HlyD family secretion protein [Ferrimonas kyonanensis]|uniref:HlyD family secretion protein n=1 Tax=Ferrimonas kyonanensis TaxID=364763 RepID=UPI0004285018|nr:HlyD family secretion protein [Ferrimonas kyonanensis]